jgi:hypothetical protein
MLKPADPAMVPGDPGEERPVGELVNQLVEDGKAYAQSEFGLVKAIAAQKAGALALPIALFAVAFMLVQAGVNALAVGVLLAIDSALGPLLAGLLAFLIFAAIAGGLAWWAMQKIKRSA